MSKEELLTSMRIWLGFHCDYDVTMKQIFVLIDKCEGHRKLSFYNHFAPLMAQIIDGEPYE